MGVSEILIIDDSRLELMRMENFLSDLTTCQPTLIENPTQALNWCHGNDPDLVVVDYQMPGLDGLGFIKAFREIAGREDTPLVMITASDTETVCVNALKGGANDFICKPVRKAEFLARISNMLALRQKQKNAGSMIQSLNKEVDATAKVVTEREADDDRVYVKKAVNWALRNIGKRNVDLRVEALRVAYRILEREPKSARWIAKNAIKELEAAKPKGLEYPRSIYRT